MIFLLLNVFAGKIYAQENQTTLLGDTELVVDEEIESLADSPAPEETPEETPAAGEGATESLAAEENGEDKNYYITTDEKNHTKFVQRLSWQEVPNIKYYKIQIQKKEGEEYTNVFETELNETFIEVSLEPGLYRLEVTTINLFDKKKTQQKEFEVLKAFIPAIKNVTPAQMNINKKNADGIFTIKGENFLPQNIVKLQGVKDNQDKVLYGKVLEISDDGKTAQVQFNMEEADDGEYLLVVTNPGGFSDEYQTINVKSKKGGEWNFFISGGYALPITFYDGTLDKFTEKKILPISANAKIAAVRSVGKIGSVGFGLNANYSLIKAETNVYKITGHFINALACAVYQKEFIPNRFALNLHAGAGVCMITGLNFEYTQVEFESPDFKGLGLAFGGGFGVQYYPLKRLYIEAGADFIHNKFKDMNYGAVYPALSVGGKF